MKQHTPCEQTGSTQSSPTPPAAELSLLAQYHEIWSTIDQQEAEQQHHSDSNTISISDCFSAFDLQKCIDKVSFDLIAEDAVVSDQPETSQPGLEAEKEETISQKMVKSFAENQAPCRQLCHVRAHQRDQQTDIFQNLRSFDLNSVFVGRPHAQSMQQATVSQFKSTRQASWNSPQLQPTVIGQQAGSAPTKTTATNDDVRSLLYCSSDSDEIESLVFNNATEYPHD
jgi:hypothetical protein